MAEAYPEPVDGYTVEHEREAVIMTLTDRYGAGERYVLDAISASRLGHALIAHSTQCLEHLE